MSPSLRTAVRRLQARLGPPPALALVLGSGFQSFADGLKPLAELSTDAIPGFPPVRVPGHQPRLIRVEVAGLPVLLQCGRVHYYEGHPMSAVTFPVRLLAAYGVQALFLTNAAGAINRRFKAGDFMMITDHLNGMGTSPLRSDQPAKVPTAFTDMSAVYDAAMNRQLAAAAKTVGLRLRQGVYLAVSGPNYETPAEIRAFRGWGADAVGMSTVPEAMVARQQGLRVAALSCLTNLAAGLSAQPISHTEVLEQGHQNRHTAAALLTAFVQNHAKARSR